MKLSTSLPALPRRGYAGEPGAILVTKNDLLTVQTSPRTALRRGGGRFRPALLAACRAGPLSFDWHEPFASQPGGRTEPGWTTAPGALAPPGARHSGVGSGGEP